MDEEVDTYPDLITNDIAEILIKEGKTNNNESEDGNCSSSIENYVLRLKEALSNLGTFKRHLHHKVMC